MTDKNEVKQGSMFPKGEKIENENFIGEAWLKMIVTDIDTFNCKIGNVTFAPGARNNWHTHTDPGGQILMVTGGTGYYQEEGNPAQKLTEGDVVEIEPEVKHWHGAAPDSWFSHIFIVTNAQEGGIEWQEPVTEEYDKLK